MRVLPLLALTCGVLALPTVASAQPAGAESAAIVGGDSTLMGLTGHVMNPEAYTAGTQQGAVGINLLFPEDDGASNSVWAPTFVWGVDDRWELGGYGWMQDAEDADDVFGVSLKFKFYDERAGSDIVLTGQQERPEGGWPSMAGYYTYQGSGDLNAHRLGFVASWTFEEETKDRSFANTTFSAGAVYNFFDTDSDTIDIDKNDFDWFVGAIFRPDSRVSISLEYEDDDDDGFVTEGFAGAIRWHINPEDAETVWTLQAGVVNNDSILVGVQAGF